MADFYVSPSQLKLFQSCPRSWYLKYVLQAPDDQGAGGQYLQRGQEFDALADSYVAGTPAPDVPQLAQRQLAETRRYLPEPGTAVTQHKYRVVHPEGFVIGGKADFRRPGRIWDTKTTSDRGPGEGAGPDRPAYALTDETLASDPQALTYTWCEFQGDPALAEVPATWVYVSKAPAPRAWIAHHEFTRYECDVWFADEALPIMRRMRDYRDARLRSVTVPSNPEACRRCFVVWSCPGAFEGSNVFDGEVRWRRTACPTPPSTGVGPTFSRDATTLDGEATRTTGAEASGCATGGAVSRRSLPMSVQGLDLVTALTESITRVTTSRATSGGQPTLNRMPTAAGQCGPTNLDALASTPAAENGLPSGPSLLESTLVSSPNLQTQSQQEGDTTMAFDLSKLKRGPAATPAAPAKPELTEVLTESVVQATMARLERVEQTEAAVAINRPEADVLHVGTIDGTPAALAQLVLEESSPGAQAPAREEPAIAAAPKARRGRPPKGGGTGSAPATAAPPTPSADASSGADSPAAESAKPSVIEQAKAVREAALALVVELNGLIGGGA